MPNTTAGDITGRRRRKIMPFVPDATANVGPHELETLMRQSRDKAADLNQHALGYGRQVEAEWSAVGIAAPDLAAMRTYRLQRIRAELKRHDYAGALLYDPVNIRYATDSTNMQVWVAHNPTRYCLVATEGPVILFDYHACEHLSGYAGVVDEVRPTVSFMYFYGGDLTPSRVRRWGEDIEEIVAAHGGGNRRIAVDRLDAIGVEELARRGISVHSGEEVMERARLIKSPDEILCMRRAITACENAMAEMEAALEPGISENELWAVLHKGNIARGGEWIETRLLASGPRTNPWFQECSSRVVEAGDTVAFDTDLIGPYGFCADVSRTWLCGGGKATGEQKTLYRLAAEQIEANRALLRPDATVRELSETARSLPDDCMPTRYSCLYHGVGLADEYPTIPYKVDCTDDTPDEVLRPGMVVCVESYVGQLGGREGVKIEEQMLITKTGHEQLSHYPLDDRLG